MTIARDLSKILDANGDLNIDANTLFVDSSTNSVGIGTNSPSALIHSSGTSIGTEIYGKFSTGSLTGDQNLTIQSSSGRSFMGLQVKTGGAVVQPLALNPDGGNVGIGETSPLGHLHIKSEDVGVSSVSAQGDLLVLEGTETGLSIINSTSGAGYINFGDSGDNDIGKLVYDHPTNTLKFHTNASEKMRVNSSGRVGIGETNPTGSLHVRARDSDGADVFVITQSELNNRQSGYKCLDENGNIGLVMKYDNGGNNAIIQNSVNGNISLYLGGTGSANLLDDYEEGTWTPTFTSSGGAYTVSYSGQQGRYTKIGQTVICHFLCAASGTPSGGSGDFRLGGLPFTPHTESVFQQHGSVGITNNFNINIDADQVLWVIQTDGTYANMMYLRDNSGTTTTGNMPNTVIHNSNPRCDGTIVYRTNS